MSTGLQYWWGANQEELDLEDALEEADKKRDTKPDMHWREAYELNKTRSKCILCGDPTEKRMLYATVVNYCQCVEKYID